MRRRQGLAPDRLPEEAVPATERAGLDPADLSSIFGLDVEDGEPGA